MTHSTCLATNDNLPVHEDKGRGVYVKGLLEVFVGSVDEVYEAMRRGQGARVVAYTSMFAIFMSNSYVALIHSL